MSNEVCRSFSEVASCDATSSAGAYNCGASVGLMTGRRDEGLVG